MNIRHKCNTNVRILIIVDNHTVSRDFLLHESDMSCFFVCLVFFGVFFFIQIMVPIYYVNIIITDIQLPDSCVKVVKHSGPVPWMEARDSCGRLGGVLAIVSRAQHWLYVSRALRHYLRGQSEDVQVYMGLRTSPDHFPSM